MPLKPLPEARYSSPGFFAWQVLLHLGSISDLVSAIIPYKTALGAMSRIGDDLEYYLPGLPSAMTISADGKYLFVSTSVNPIEGGGEDLIISYAIDARTGLLTRLSEQPCAAATSALAKAMGGRYLYACSYASRTIYGYQVDGNGMLTQKSVTQTGGISDGMAAVDLA